MHEALSRAQVHVRQGGKIPKRREAPSSPVALGSLTNMHPPPIFVRPSCHRQVGGEANAASSRVQWVTRSCSLRPQIHWICIRLPRPCHRYRYVRTRIRFRVGSSNPARSHFSQILEYASRVSLFSLSLFYHAVSSLSIEDASSGFDIAFLYVLTSHRLMDRVSINYRENWDTYRDWMKSTMQIVLIILK